MSRQVDGATPQPVQKMTCDELLLFVVKQQSLTNKVVTCYEAGAFGFHLHRRFEELGIKNYVVQPQDWDERGKGVKNDRLDAAELCQRLDRYERGNKNALSVFRPWTKRGNEPSRDSGNNWCGSANDWRRWVGVSLRRTISMSRGNGGKAWTGIKMQAPAWVVERLEVFIVILGPVEEQEIKRMRAIQESAQEQKIPRGVGPLTFEILRREVGDGSRFNNRRQVSSDTGVCPRERSSGGKRRAGSVSKSGNPRVRAMLVERV